MAAAVLHLRDIALTFGGTPLLEAAELAVAPGERLALVGRNGSGKSTLLKIAAGLTPPDAGERFVQPGMVVRYLPQEPNLSGVATTLDYVAAGLGPQRAAGESDEHADHHAGDLHHDLHRARSLLDRLGLTGAEDPAKLSGGEARRCALARALAPQPDILLLDEPTNHLDLPAIEWLEAELAGMRAAIVLISHDRRFLTTLSRATVWLEGGRTRRLERGFGAFEAWRDEIVEREETERHKLARKLAAETHWLHRGVTARRKRNQGRLRALHALRAQWREQRRAGGAVTMTQTTAEVSGKLVAEAEHVSKSFAGKPVVRDLSLRIARGDRLGIVGPNGAGKTTLIKLLTGALAPDAGTVKLGANLQMVTLDQTRESLDAACPLAEALTGGRGETVSVAGTQRHVIGYMKDFLFTPEQARTPVGALSGGERGRLMLARALARPSNLLVLDEPTNDLDLETLDLLQEMIADYAGTVLLVSHDRDFLDRTVTATLASEGDGRWTAYAGGYSDMMAQRAGVSTEEAAVVASAKKKETPQGDSSKSGRAAPPAVGAPPQPSARPAAKAAKLSFKEKRALEILPARIDDLHAEIAGLRARLADATLYGRDPAGFETAAAALRDAEEALASAEEEWLALELKREGAERA